MDEFGSDVFTLCLRSTLYIRDPRIEKGRLSRLHARHDARLVISVALAKLQPTAVARERVDAHRAASASGERAVGRSIE